MSERLDLWCERYYLTQAERDVLELAILGEDQTAIAKARGTSTETIKSLSGRVVRKVRARSLLDASRGLLLEVCRRRVVP